MQVHTPLCIHVIFKTHTQKENAQFMPRAFIVGTCYLLHRRWEGVSRIAMRTIRKHLNRVPYGEK